MFQVAVKGVPEAQARLRACLAILNDIPLVRADLLQAAQPMAALARELSPHAYEYPGFSSFRAEDSDPSWNWVGQGGTARGTLRNSIDAVPRAAGMVPTVAVTARTPYARAQEYGAFITPRSAKYLHFIGKEGADVFARSVTLPARPYMRPAYEALWREVPIHFALRLAVRFATVLGGRR